MKPYCKDGSCIIYHGDCVEKMREMPENSVDSVVCDPPYFLRFMGRNWDSAPTPKQQQEQHEAWAREALRVLKPGGYLLAFGGTRTHHRLACAIEDAGFEIRDTLQWVYASGFPKSHNIQKALEKQGEHEAAEKYAGWGSALKPAHEPIVCARKPLSEKNLAQNVMRWGTGGLNIDQSRVRSSEPIASHRGTGNGVAMQGNVAENGWKQPYQKGDAGEHNTQTSGRFPSNLLLSHAPGCIRTGSKRVKPGNGSGNTGKRNGKNGYDGGWGAYEEIWGTYNGPDGKEEVAAYECESSCPVRLMDEQSGPSPRGGKPQTRNRQNGATWALTETVDYQPYADTMSGDSGPSRFFQQFLPEPDTTPGFFYSPKASRAERNKGLEGMPEKETGLRENGRFNSGGRSLVEGEWVETGSTPKPKANTHPCVKPVALLSYLLRLVTPPNGTTLDPFAGSGSTGVAALSEGFNAILIEQDEEYCNIAQARCRHALNPTPETPKKNGKARNTYGFRTNKEAKQAEDLTLFEEGA